MKIRARVDWENGCERCWDAARAAGVVDVDGDAGHVLAPAEWIGRPCPHGASECAPSILLPAVDASEELVDLAHRASELAKRVNA